MHDAPASALPVAADVELWIGDPDVLADPYQVEGGQVWTRASDLMPDVIPRPGMMLTAAWEDLTWKGLPDWDADDVEVLWLRPQGAPVSERSPRGRYTLEDLVDRLVDATRGTGAKGATHTEQELRVALGAVLTPLLGTSPTAWRCSLPPAAATGGPLRPF